MAELNTSSPPTRALDPPAAAPSAPAEPSAAAPASASPPAPSRAPRQWQPSIHQIYKQPAPLRTFPFPTFTTSNPISLVHLAVAWLSHIFSPPPPEPSVVHTAYWDHDTRSIVVTDEKSMADLWQQGFYGKGSLSRSEPNWLKRERIRRGVLHGKVSEANTEKRREDRVRAKWERARAEQEAIEQKRLKEAKALAEAAAVAPLMVPTSPALLPPVGPLELLALPNSQADLMAALRCQAKRSEDSMGGTDTSADDSGSSGNDEADSNTTLSSDPTELKRRKSVRFSPKVESTVFQHTDPPSPPRSVSSSSLKADPITGSDGAAHLEKVLVQPASPTTDKPSQESAEADTPLEAAVVNKEHLQLAPEETFFLAFALGVLKVIDTATKNVLATRDLLSLLRQTSYFPPRMSQQLQPDDPFLIQYAVYHHFRSLGWVPRPGIKFGVDWLLYMRGPVFDHAEYGVVVLPSYADPEWTAGRHQLPLKSWHWLMGVNRVLSKVFKSFVLVYVDIPPPTAFGENGEPTAGLVDLLKQYKIREQMVKRWSGNRNR